MYTYAFTQDGAAIILTIENANGNQAIYRNTQLSVSKNKKLEVHLYPNPVNTSFQLEVTSDKEINSIRIFSVHGKEVLRFKEAQTSYDVSQLSKGVYFVQIESETGKSLKKIVKK